MDLIGEIVEKDTVQPSVPEPPKVTDIRKIHELKQKRGQLPAGEFPRRQSRFKAQQRVDEKPAEKKIDATEPLSELEKIDKENEQKVAGMTPEQIEQERKELYDQFSPDLLNGLLRRAAKKEKKEKKEHHDHDHDHQHAEGYDGWIGGVRGEDGVKDLTSFNEGEIEQMTGGRKSSKSVRFSEVASVRYEDLPEDVQIDETGWEDVEDINDLVQEAPKDYQLVNDEEDHDGVHFTKPHNNTPEYGKDLDLNDPEFYDKLHEKYYPDLPKETSKLAWMTQPMPVQKTSTYESISDMRFDFQGNLVELAKETEDVPTHLGLHHHSDNPHLPGYTISELAHLTRSVVAGQRCLSIQMLGRILHKLGSRNYNIIPVSEDSEDQEFNRNAGEVNRQFEKLMWDHIDGLRVIESIEEAADEKRTSNLSVRNYAIEALWLWKQGGGRPQSTEEDELEKIM